MKRTIFLVCIWIGNVAALELASFITQAPWHGQVLVGREQEILSLLGQKKSDDIIKSSLQRHLEEGMLPASLHAVGEKLLEMRPEYKRIFPHTNAYQDRMYIRGGWLLHLLGKQTYTLITYPAAYAMMRQQLLEKATELRDVWAIKKLFPLHPAERLAYTHKAADLGLQEIVKFAIKQKGVDKHSVYKGVTLLVRAARARAEHDPHDVTLHYLLSLPDINVNQQTERGNTALHYAACIGLQRRIRALCSCGARLDIANQQTLTPLDIALSYQPNIIDFLKQSDTASSVPAQEKDCSLAEECV